MYIPGSGRHPVELAVVDATVVAIFVVELVVFVVVNVVVIFVVAIVVAFVVAFVVVLVVGFVFAALVFGTVVAADRCVGCFFHVRFPFHPILLPGPQFWFHSHSLEWGGQH